MGFESDHEDARWTHAIINPTKLNIPWYSLGAIYTWDIDLLYYSNLSIIEPWERTVHCLFCNSMATLKPTKTRRIMLRCNTCSTLVFANGAYSQRRIKTLRDFRFTPVRDLV